MVERRVTGNAKAIGLVFLSLFMSVITIVHSSNKIRQCKNHGKKTVSVIEDDSSKPEYISLGKNAQIL